MIIDLSVIAFFSFFLNANPTDDSLKKNYPRINSEISTCYKAKMNRKKEVVLLQKESDGNIFNAYWSGVQEKILYDEKGNWITHSNYDVNGILLSSTHYLQAGKTDFKSIRIFQSYHSYDPFYQSTTIWTAQVIDSTYIQTDSTFDGYGKLTDVSIWKQKTKDSISYSTFLDSNQKIEKYSIIDFSKGYDNMITYYFDQDSVLISTSYQVSDSLMKYNKLYSIKNVDTITIYNEKLNEYKLPIHRISATYNQREEGNEYYFEYEYDEYENWTRKLIFNRNRDLIYVIQRELSYYQ